MTPARPSSAARNRYDFHSHTFLTDGTSSATDMWQEADVLGHRALAITDHIALEDPVPLLERLRQEAKAWENDALQTLIGVEVTMVHPRRIPEVVRAARRAGAEVVIVHGETPANPVPPGTNRAVVEMNDVDVLAHPGFITVEEAELAKAHDVVLEVTARRLHLVTNGHVVRTALQVGNDLVVDSDAHATNELVTLDAARIVARGAGVPDTMLTRVLAETPRRLLRRCGKP
ncbi:MAG: histidinol phosphate phosphatase domain-containing protein [Thermoplasmata archaeon]|nr:histidinol phosphate phosphatase domain-containing protein [Thermoplasmata archaeon]